MEHAQSVPLTVRTHRRWIAAAAGALAAAGIALAPALPASAVSPVQLDSSYVTDEADVLTPSEEDAANARLAQAFDKTGLDLYVVFVDHFTDPSDRIDWANETADANGLGDSQYLLAVSTEGRQYFISSLDTGPLSDSQLERIEEHLLPELRDSDWAGAITAAADQLEVEHAAPGRNTAMVLGVGAGVLGVGGAAVGGTVLVRKRRTKRELEAEFAELERVSGSGLVAADDAVKSSAQELEFARAQFGDAAVTDFAAALETAKASLIEAFKLRQQLDDAIPDTEAQRREWLGKIIELCTAVDTGLDAQAGAFTELRAIAQNAPAALAQLTARRQQAVEAGAAARSVLAQLASIYAPEELTTLGDSTKQAGALLDFAEGRESLARTALEGSTGAAAITPDLATAAAAAPAPAVPAPAAAASSDAAGTAAVAIREAEAAVAQAEDLHRAVSAHGAELAQLTEQAHALAAEIDQDLAQAGTLTDPSGQASPEVQQAIRTTTAQLAQARAELTGTARRPSHALEALTAANTAIDGAIATAQETARARQLLDATRTQTAEQVWQTAAYITARRGAIGATARTRASEAQAALDRADATREADPRGTLAELQRAAQLAAQALSQAQRDVSGFDTGGAYGGGYGGGYGGSSRSSDGDLGAILGGIFGYGGGGSYGGYGGSGSSWGGSSRSRSRSSSWGGSSSRSRSSSSRRSSGGSRRSSGGGRF